MTPRPVVLASPCTGLAEGNPYIGLLNREIARQGYDVRSFDRRPLLDRPAVVHVHWPELLIRWSVPWRTSAGDVVKVLALLGLARLRGTVIVWTAHNLRPHHANLPRLVRPYMRVFGALTSGVISLSDPATVALRRTHPWLRRKPMRTIAHGHYRDLYSERVDKDEAREHLGLSPDTLVVLIMGQIRRYKQIDQLVERFESRREHGSVLLIAGGVEDDGLRTTLEAAAGPSTKLRLGFVPEDEVPLLHAAADVVVLPYAGPSVLNSGAAILGLSLARPVVLRRTETTEHLQGLVGEEWVRLFTGSTDDAIDLALASRGAPPAADVAPDLSELDWGPIGAATAHFYNDLRSARHSWRLLRRAQ